MNLSINDVIYPIEMQWKFNTGSTINRTVITVWNNLFWIEFYHERRKTTLLPSDCCERVAYIGFLSFFIMKTQIF